MVDQGELYMSSQVTDIYSDKYVAFLDLLGFKSKVNEADKKPDVRKEILNALDILRDTLCNDDNTGMRFTHFSDCMVLTVNHTPAGLLEILHAIEVLTLNLLSYDFFVRGGLSVGGAYHDQNFVFGSAVNCANRLQEEAVYPMTLVSNDVVADLKAYGLQIDELLTHDAEKRYFVHYLKSYAEYTRLPLLPGKVMLDETGKRIVDFICHRLYTETDPDVRAKNTWFQNYWNDKVAIRGVFGRIEDGVSERDLGHGPTLIKRRRLAGFV
jgi:hypothetical protein